MASLFKRVDRKSAKYRTAPWYVKFKDHEGNWRYERGSVDRAATQELANKLEADALLRRRGILDPVAEALAAHGGTSIDAHITDFEAHLTAKGNTAAHVEETINAVKDAMKGALASTVRDIDATRVLAHVQSLRSRKKRPIGARSYNKRLKACKAFCGWLVKSRRLATNPLAHLSVLNGRTDRRRKRRAFTMPELIGLLTATENGPALGGVIGPDRALGYRVAAGTGFRRRELNSLTPESFDLDRKQPTVTVHAAYSKHRRDDCQQIAPDLADRLRPWLASRPRGVPLWTFPHESAELFRIDLDAAKIAPRNESDEVLDFHSLRHTYVTILASAGLPTVIVKEMARHASVTTTERYMHARLADRARAIDALGSLGNAPEAAVAQATGTDDAAAIQTAPEERNSAQHLAQHGGRTEGHRLALVGTTDSPAPAHRKPGKRRGLQTKNPRQSEGSRSEADGT